MTNKKILYLLVICACLLEFSENCLGQKKKIPPRRSVIIQTVGPVETDSSPELKRRIETFDSVWQIIKSNYFDQTFSGLDWDKIKTEYEPRVRQTTSDRQLHEILQEMISRLDRSHLAIIPPEVYQAIEKAKIEAKAREKATAKKDSEISDKPTADENEPDEEDYTTRFGIGVDLRLIDERFIITHIDKNSAAERAGLKLGYVIQKINAVSLAELLQKIEISNIKVRNFKRYLPSEIGNYMLNGEKDSVVTLTCLNENEQSVEFKVPREPLKGVAISLGKNLPEQYLEFETASLSEEVGLIRFNVFALPVIEKFCAALTELKDKKAIVIDLRGNMGGILGTLVGVSGMLTEKSIDLGTSLYKVGSENFTALSKAKNYKGKIVFLVDNQTVSAAEIFAAALQENNRAVIVGEKTAGEALPAISVPLPTGAVLYYPIANFKTHNGNFLEGKGVEPDYVAALDRKTLLSGTDAQIAAALKIIKENTAFPKPDDNGLIIKGMGNTPPPPPAAVPKLKQLGSVTIKAAPLPPMAKPVEYTKKDEKALQVISDFVRTVGGAENFEKISSYTLKGETELTVKGTKNDMEIQIYRQKPDKYAEVWKSEAIGEVRQIYSETQNFMQSDFGITQNIPATLKATDVEIFSLLNNLMKKEYFKSLKYQGIFDRQDKKAHVIEAVTKDGLTVALVFEVETKLLVSYAYQFYGVSFGDYRKVDNVMLPFSLEREGFMNIKFSEIKINTVLDESDFTKKWKCYDKAN